MNNISVGIPPYTANIIPHLSEVAGDLEKVDRMILGRKFRDLEDVEGGVLVYAGDKVLDKFVVPNVGLDMPVYCLNDEDGLQKIEKGIINKLLAKRYNNL